MSPEVTYTCNHCRAVAVASIGELPRGWFAAGPSDGPKYPSGRTIYGCSSTCLMAAQERNAAALAIEEQIG
jgi:hypothetical protein